MFSAVGTLVLGLASRSAIAALSELAGSSE